MSMLKNNTIDTPRIWLEIYTIVEEKKITIRKRKSATEIRCRRRWVYLPFLLTEQCTAQISSLRQQKEKKNILPGMALVLYNTIYGNVHCFRHFSLPHEISSSPFRQLFKESKKKKKKMTACVIRKLCTEHENLVVRVTFREVFLQTFVITSYAFNKWNHHVFGAQNYYFNSYVHTTNNVHSVSVVAKKKNIFVYMTMMTFSSRSVLFSVKKQYYVISFPKSSFS